MYRNILNTYLEYNIFNFGTNSVSTFNMSESTEKTNKTIEKYPIFCQTLRNYIVGNCYYNGKISHNLALTEEEKQETNNLDKLIMETEPITKPLYLFHGFEAGLKYNDNKWKIGEEMNFSFHLSKTPAFWIARGFSDHFSWYFGKKQFGNITNIPLCYDIGYISATKTLFMQKILFCIYEEPNKWKHVSTNIRCPKDMLKNLDNKSKLQFLLREEFEYLSHKNEKFVLVDVVYKYQFSLPFVYKFYIVKRI